MSTERDTHFLGFAENLAFEILEALDFVYLEKVDRFYDNVAERSVDPKTMESIERIIAQRAYDFASHVLDETTEHDLWIFKQSDEGLEDIVPDLTEWPKPD